MTLTAPAQSRTIATSSKGTVSAAKGFKGYSRPLLGASPYTFLSKANSLLSHLGEASSTARPYLVDSAQGQSRAEAVVEEHFEIAYQAALRLSGAIVESALAERKRRPRGSTWELLRKYGGSFSSYADFFEPYSRVRERIRSGLSYSLSVKELMEFEDAVLKYGQSVNEYYGWIGYAA